MKYTIQLSRYDTIADKYLQLTEEISATNYIIDNEFTTFYLGSHIENLLETNIASFKNIDIISIKSEDMIYKV